MPIHSGALHSFVLAGRTARSFDHAMVSEREIPLQITSDGQPERSETIAHSAGGLAPLSPTAR